MESSQEDRDARVERMLGELDDVEARIDELRPVGQVRTMVTVLVLLLVVVAAFLAVLILPAGWELAPFLVAAGGFALVGLRSISAKGEELAELQRERARLTRGPTA
jgi:fatty acid desaturase